MTAIVQRLSTILPIDLRLNPRIWATLLAGVFFITAQSAALAHGEINGDVDHTHACALCGLSGLGDDDDDALPGAEFHPADGTSHGIGAIAKRTGIKPAFRSTYAGRAPPGIFQ